MSNCRCRNTLRQVCLDQLSLDQLSLVAKQTVCSSVVAQTSLAWNLTKRKRMFLTCRSFGIAQKALYTLNVSLTGNTNWEGVLPKHKIFCHGHWRAHFQAILGEYMSGRSPKVASGQVFLGILEIAINFFGVNLVLPKGTYLPTQIISAILLISYY